MICTETAEEVAQDADALVLVTEWPQYMQLDWEAVARQHALGYSCGWKECARPRAHDAVGFPLRRPGGLERRSGVARILRGNFTGQLPWN